MCTRGIHICNELYMPTKFLMSIKRIIILNSLIASMDKKLYITLHIIMIAVLCWTQHLWLQKIIESYFINSMVHFFIDKQCLHTLSDNIVLVQINYLTSSLVKQLRTAKMINLALTDQTFYGICKYIFSISDRQNS